jgi:hypothetical protein
VPGEERRGGSPTGSEQAVVVRQHLRDGERHVPILGELAVLDAEQVSPGITSSTTPYSSGLESRRRLCDRMCPVETGHFGFGGCLVEQRYRVVLEVIKDGLSVVEVAAPRRSVPADGAWVAGPV